MPLSKGRLRQFKEDGFLVYGPLLDQGEAEALGRRIDLLALQGGGTAGAGVRVEREAETETHRDADELARIRRVMGATLHDELIWQHASNPTILDVVAVLLQSEAILLLSDQIVMKPSRRGSAVYWHQDSWYWSNILATIDPPSIVTCWTAVDAATEDNGCLRVVPGSHKQGVLPHRQGNDSVLGIQGVDSSEAVPLILGRGACSFHHSCAVHGSGANLSSERRRGLAVAYIRSDFTWLGRPEGRPSFRSILVA